MKNISIIQVFRGIAAMSVVLFHLSERIHDYLGLNVFYSVFKFGWSGVEFFFVLSGFIITYIHFGDIGKRSSLKPYLLKRGIRIYPIYWVVCLIYLAIYFFPDRSLLMSHDLMYYVKSLLLIKVVQGPFLGVAWTLVFEMCFYVIFALFICSGRRVSFVFYFVWIILIISRQGFGLGGNHFFFNSGLFDIYNILFLFGCAAGYLVRRGKLHFPRLSFFSGLLVLVLVYSLLYREVIVHDQMTTEILFGIGFSLLIYGAVAMDISVKSDKGSRVLMLLGNASYSLYLIHYIPVKVSIFGIRKFISFYHFRFSGLPSFYLDFALYLIYTMIFIFILGLGVILHLYVEKRIMQRIKVVVGLGESRG